MEIKDYSKENAHSKDDEEVHVDVFKKCGVDPQRWTLRCTHVSRLHEFMKNELKCSQSELDDTYLWSSGGVPFHCVVKIKNMVYGDANSSSINKSTAREKAAEFVLEKLRFHPLYYQYFLVSSVLSVTLSLFFDSEFQIVIDSNSFCRFLKSNCSAN